MCNIDWNFFFFTDTATTEIYTLSLHDALPISDQVAEDPDAAEEHDHPQGERLIDGRKDFRGFRQVGRIDRKSTRLNSSHGYISYAVFCLKKKMIEYPFK